MRGRREKRKGRRRGEERVKRKRGRGKRWVSLVQMRIW